MPTKVRTQVQLSWHTQDENIFIQLLWLFVKDRTENLVSLQIWDDFQKLVKLSKTKMKDLSNSTVNEAKTIGKWLLDHLQSRFLEDSLTSYQHELCLHLHIYPKRCLELNVSLRVIADLQLLERNNNEIKANLMFGLHYLGHCKSFRWKDKKIPLPAQSGPRRQQKVDKKEEKKMEMPGFDPGTFRMLSGRDTNFATPPFLEKLKQRLNVFHFQIPLTRKEVFHFEAVKRASSKKWEECPSRRRMTGLSFCLAILFFQAMKRSILIFPTYFPAVKPWLKKCC